MTTCKWCGRSIIPFKESMWANTGIDTVAWVMDEPGRQPWEDIVCEGAEGMDRTVRIHEPETVVVTEEEVTRAVESIQDSATRVTRA